MLALDDLEFVNLDSWNLIINYVVLDNEEVKFSLVDMKGPTGV